MMQVWKLEIDKDGSYQLPTKARFLSVQRQRDSLCAWFMVDPANHREYRHFVLVGTGMPFDDAGLNYLGTALLLDDSLVLHLFERTP